MAYIRTIKASFFTSDDIVSLSPIARLLYIALWTEADREGRLTWRPGNFKLRFLPGDACDIQELCGELVESGLVVTYSVDGKTYAEIPTFKRHQSINAKERKSVLPERVAKATDTRNDATTTGDDAWRGFLQERKGTGEEASPPSHAGGTSTLVNCVHSEIPSGINSSNGGDDEF
jgi:hypothetical protein